MRILFSNRNKFAGRVAELATWLVVHDIERLASMSFNTAVFYDIENLLKGYSFSPQMAANLSLEEILKAIKNTGRISKIAVQRAYANWSDARLAMMRGEINELGIDPIQVFGFSRDQKKNAADIQLAIDAIDLAHVRPMIDVFVIVSGDGGFASLAKKLHEYGKTVIGCAYRNATNRTFQSVCDDFVWVNDPDEEERQEKVTSAVAASNHAEVTDPRNVRLTAKIRKIANLSSDAVLQKAREVLTWYVGDPASKADLSQGGLFLNVVQEALKFAVPGFQASRYGFPKFIEYMQFACRGMPVCVARPPNSQAMLVMRGTVGQGVEILPDLEPRELHSVEGYRAVLATGSPLFRLPQADEIEHVARWITQKPPEKQDVGSLIESAVHDLDGRITSESAKLALLSLVSAEAFEREPSNATLFEQKLTLVSEIQAGFCLIQLLRGAIQKKLIASLGSVQDAILEQLLPAVTHQPLHEMSSEKSIEKVADKPTDIAS